MSHISLTNAIWEVLDDPSTDRRLLPAKWRGGDNARRIRHCKIALRKAIERHASPMQRQQLSLYYGQNISKSEIARRQGVTCSTVVKSLRTCLSQIEAYVVFYMSIYDAVERELLSDDSF